MALSDLTFKLYNDASLTSPFNGTLTITHETDLSDNPQDFVLYFGSTTASRELEANSDPGVDDITITPTDYLDAWEASTAYSLGDCVEPTTPNGFRYEVTTAGTSDSSEPTWPTTGIGTSTVTDNTVVWTLVSAKHETTEIKLATSAAGLTGAVAGAAVVMGTTISSGVGNLVELHIRVTNAVTNVSDNTDCIEIKLDINEVVETAA